MADRARRSAHPVPHSRSLSMRVGRAATSPAAKAVYIAVGAVGLAALAIAIFGPRRFQRVVIHPSSPPSRTRPRNYGARPSRCVPNWAG